MSENLHQRSKDIFGKLVDLPREAQARELERLCSSDPQLKREVASLLDFHTARSLMAEPPKPKIRHRSTLSTTRLHKSWREKTFAYLPVLTQLLLLAMVLPILWHLVSLVKKNDTALVARELESMVAERSFQLLQWHRDWQSKMQQITAKPSLQQLISDLISKPEGDPPNANGSMEIQRSIEEALAAPATFCFWDKKMRLLSRTQFSSNESELPGWTPFRCADLMQAANGTMVIRMPTSKQGPLPPPLTTYEAIAFCPVRDSSNALVGTLVIQSAALTTSFDLMVSSWTILDSPKVYDSYVVDSNGYLVSNLRFGERYERLLTLTGAGRSANPSGSSGAQSTEKLHRRDLLMRDPGMNLLDDPQAATQSANWPLTLAVNKITEGNSGSNVNGYRNYLGQKVAGAWDYLPDQHLGVVSELDYEDAFKLRGEVNSTLLLLISIISLATLISIAACWPKRRTRDVQSVGPYKMQEMLGEGGMGKVYLAEHSLLCRPTAIKILSAENADLSVLMRFEREVQLASQLTHPNTISIYDFGRNEAGLFYYAMEYIDGGHLGQLVEFDGPLPPGRCVYLVRQLCFALREAHLAGVVHRDIKPQNVMLCDRGGEPDFIKLVDYGLVKAFAPGVSDSTSQTNFIIGTPRFMAPERLQSPWLADPRVDIYSIGGLIYYMLTADLPPLVTPTVADEPADVGVETLNLHNIADSFSRLLDQCMSYDSSSRPSSIASLLIELDRLSIEFPWTREDSEKWWKRRGAKFKQFLATKRKNVNGNI